MDSLNLEELTDSDLRLLDSALIIYHNAKHDTDQINAIGTIVEDMVSNDWISYNQILEQVVERNLLKNPPKLLKNHYLKFLAIAINNKGIVHDNNGEVKKAIKSYEKSLKIRKSINDKDGISNSLNNLAVSYNDLGELDKAIEYHNEALKIRNEINDIDGIATTLNNLGYIFRHQGNTIKALTYYFKSLKISEKLGNKQDVALSFNNIGFIHYSQENFTEALSYFKKGLKIRMEIDDKYGTANTLGNIGLIYRKQGEINKALKIFKESLSKYEEINNKKGIIGALSIIGDIYATKEEYDDALEQYNRALNISEEMFFKEGIAQSLHGMGFVFTKQGNLKLAEKYELQSFEIVSKLGLPKFINNSAEQLSTIYKLEGNYKKSLEMYELYITMRDSIQNENTEKIVIQQEANYQVEKKEQELELQKKNIEVLEKDKRLKNYTLYGLIGFIFLLLTSTYLWFRNYKFKKNIQENEIRYQLDLYIKEIELLKNIEQKTNIVDTIKKGINPDLKISLSERELGVLNELSKGKTNKEIAKDLFLSINTVKFHLKSIYEKLDVKNRTQAVKKVNVFGNSTQMGGE